MKNKRLSPLLKRIFDVVFALFVIPISFIPTVICMMISFLLIGRFPVISQERMITIEKKKFKLYKIRTIKNSQEFNYSKSSKNIFYKSVLKQYIPQFCVWLRKSGIDEILQIYSVLKGDMSFVGPRPFCEHDMLTLKNENHELYLRRNKINSKPGITGYWQINCKRDEGAENLVLMDEYYETNKSFLLDMKIILRTLFIIVSAAHSDSIVGNNYKSSKGVLSYHQIPVNNLEEEIILNEK